MKLTIVIPCYNELGTIDAIIDAVRASPYPDKEIIIVEDCSTDGTREKLKTEIEGSGRVQKVIYHDRNQGKGAALRTGFTHATGDIVIIQDADLEYDPAEYGRMIEPILADKADVVFGSRFAGGDAHRVLYFWHKVGNNFLTLLSNMFTNLDLSDMETCYKAFRREIIQSIEIEESRFGFEPEITAKVAKYKGIRIYEVGISYYGRTYEEGKKIGWKDGFRALYCIVKYNMSFSSIFKYFFVGGAAAVVDIGLFYLGAVLLNWNYLFVGTVTFILATLVNYVLSVRVVFQSGIRFSKRHEIALVFAISVAGLLLNQAILYLCISQRLVGLMVAKLVATGGVFLWNYYMRSRFVFVAANEPARTEGPLPPGRVA